ncbi:MAG: hypothetical protein R3F61_35985 [Myxococcota bacterium]
MDILLPVLFSAPVWLVLLVGIVYGGLTMGAHRTVSVLGAMALAGFLLLDLTGTVVWALYGWFIADGGAGVPVVVTQVFWLVQTLIHTLFLGLALSVAGRGRDRAA